MYFSAGDIVVPDQEAVPKSKELLATALRLDETNADAHWTLGAIHWSYDYDWVAAETEYRRAIELAPGSSDAHGFRTDLCLQWQARFRRSRAGTETRAAARSGVCG